ncbi:hypothetical protein TNCV_3502571 [Trichonephila clavipes]|uniref:Uncharacterized protein n=1 Tax=Trichonephila clavipes TaxID=2585209 RepID=A0A8X6VDR1_TRICX|nr:hypothetical protein TNCV_3502571 [Trichonephila clavipes]
MAAVDFLHHENPPTWVQKTREKPATPPIPLRHELRNPHDPGNYSNDWLDQSAASYMLAGYSPQSFHIYFSDMGWRLASRAICPENVTVVTVPSLFRTQTSLVAHVSLREQMIELEE